MERIREILFKIGLYKKCPKCKSRVIKTGYPDLIWQRYKCTECSWGKREND